MRFDPKLVLGFAQVTCRPLTRRDGVSAACGVADDLMFRSDVVFSSDLGSIRPGLLKGPLGISCLSQFEEYSKSYGMSRMLLKRERMTEFPRLPRHPHWLYRSTTTMMMSEGP